MKGKRKENAKKEREKRPAIKERKKEEKESKKNLYKVTSFY